MDHLLSTPASSIVIGAAVLALICYRQLRRKAVKEDRGYTAVIVLAAVGALQTAQAIAGVTPLEVAATAFGFATGAGFGALRAARVHLFRENGTLYRQGNAVTVVLWVVGIAVHIGIEAAGGALAGTAHAGSHYGSATLLIYLAISLGVQKAVMLTRARDLPGHSPAVS